MARSLITSLYASTALKARRGQGTSKPQASHRVMRKAHKAGAVTILRPDADGYLRECAVERSPEHKRWDTAGLYVVRS